MAAGYRTASPVFVDNKMLQLPYQLMGDVLMKQEQDFEQSAVAPMAAFDGKLKIDALPEDVEQANELVQGYEEKADDLTREIMQNPLEYQRKLHKIRGLNKELATDMQRGKWGAIDSRYKGYQSDAERIKALEAEKGYSDDYKSRLLQNQLKEAGKLKYNEDGTYNKYGAANITAMPNLNEWVDERIKDAVPDADSIEKDTLNGGWIITRGKETENMSENELATILNSSFEADAEIQAALKQRGKLGMEDFTDIIGKDGSIAPAVGLNKVKQRTEDGQKIERDQLAFAPNMLGESFRAGVSKFGFSETSNTHSMKTHTYGTQASAFEIYKKKKKFDDEQEKSLIEWGSKNKVKAFHPTNVGELNEEKTTVDSLLQATSQNAIQVLERKLGEKLDADERALLEEGDFDLLEESEVSPAIIHKYKSEYRKNYVRKMALQGIENTWEHKLIDEYNNDEEAQERMTFEEYEEFKKPEFNAFLNKNEFDNDIKYSWQGTGLNNDQVEHVQETIANGGLFKLGVTEQNGEKVTFQKLLDDGTLVVNQEKMQMTKDNPDYEEFQQLSSMTMEERKAEDVQDRYTQLMLSGNVTDKETISYKFTDGSGYVNFKVNKESFAPATSYDNDGNIDIGFMVEINGKPTVAKIPTETLTNNGIETFKSVNGEDLEFNHYIAKMKNVTDYTSDHMPGFVLDVKNRTVTTPNDTFTLQEDEGRAIAKRMLRFNL